MDRFEVKIKECFVVVDRDTGDEVFIGNKTEVEDWLDFQENQFRMKERNTQRKRRFFGLFAA